MSRVICDNGDDIMLVPKNIFKMEEGGFKNFVECKNIPAMSFNVWFGESLDNFDADHNRLFRFVVRSQCYQMARNFSTFGHLHQ